MFVLDENVVDIHGLAHERARLGVGLSRVQEIRTHARAEIVGFADVENHPLGIAIEIHAGPLGKGAYFLLQIHLSGLSSRVYAGRPPGW